MAQPSIHTLVEQTLAEQGLRHYSGTAAPVVDALIQREQALVEDIIAAGVAAGMDTEDVKDALSDLGAHIKEEVATEQASGVDTTAVVGNINSILEQIKTMQEQLAAMVAQYGRL